MLILNSEKIAEILRMRKNKCQRRYRAENTERVESAKRLSRGRVKAREILGITGKGIDDPTVERMAYDYVKKLEN